MVVHTCNRCKRDFGKKSAYIDHTNRKNPCKEKIEIIDNSIINDSCLVLHNDCKIKKKNIILPEPVKQILFTTYEIINDIKKYLEIIQSKIYSHENKYFKKWRAINITEDINNIVLYLLALLAQQNLNRNHIN
jgi:hypothetical protein